MSNGMTFCAALLAGGESRRMGRDKATIEFRGQPLWKRQLKLLRTLGPQQLFVSARTKPEWLPDDGELLLDDPPSRGPLSGLTKALGAMQTTHLIALAVDMPFMTAAELSRLVQLAPEGRGIVPTIGERVEPLAAVYPAEAAVDFQVALAGPDLSLQPLVRKLAAAGMIRMFPVSNEGERFFRSINTPEDL
jgi:molybdopterin-guanine dinucleotide biosynthesis protein A